LVTYTGANHEVIYRFYEFGYFDVVYPDKNLTELSYFPLEKKNTVETFHKKSIFVKFHTMPLEKDEATGNQYRIISLIQVEYIMENFELNIEATRNEPF